MNLFCKCSDLSQSQVCISVMCPSDREFLYSEMAEQGTTPAVHFNEMLLKVTVQFEWCFRLMKHISCRNPINPNITEKLIKFSKSLFNLYLVISNK